MTEKLKRLMHERASAHEFAVPNLERLVRDGTKRARRRSLTLVVGGLAALAVVGGTVVALQGAGGSERAEDPVSIPSGPTAPVTWAQGTVIHVGSQQIDVGLPVEAFVRTQAGFVFASDGDVYQTDGGDPQKIGQVDRERPRLVADVDNSVVGWVQGGVADSQYVVHDLVGDVTSVQPVLVSDSAATDPGVGRFYAIDDGTAYWLDKRGAVAVDLESGSTTVIDPAPSDQFLIIDAESGTIVFRLPESGDAANDGTLVGRSLDDALVLPDAYGDAGALSPDAQWYSGDDDSPAVFDTTSGERVSFDVQGFATGYEWLDADTLVMLAAEQEAGPVQLLTCAVPEGTCEVAAEDLGTFDELERSFALPVGTRLGVE